MNCKKGDIAVVINGNRSAGRVVKVGDLIPKGTIVPTTTEGWFEVAIDDMWCLVEGTVFRNHPEFGIVETEYSEDKNLRPIRDQPGEDETLTWAPVPHKETV